MPKEKINKVVKQNDKLTVVGFINSDGRLSTTLSAHSEAFKIYVKKENASEMKTFKEWQDLFAKYLKS